MYYEIYNLLTGYLYGADAVLTSDQTLTMTILSTAACVFCIAIPFIIVWRGIKLFL